MKITKYYTWVKFNINFSQIIPVPVVTASFKGAISCYVLTQNLPFYLVTWLLKCYTRALHSWWRKVLMFQESTLDNAHQF